MEDESDSCGPSQGVVAKVIDGDTIELDTGERIRYLLVDAPETGTCWGAEAKSANGQLVAGKTVDLTYDDADCEDNYGRLLAYVSVGGVDVNAMLVSEGDACMLYIPPAGEGRRAEFLGHESNAKSAGKGMWSQCSTVSCE